MGIGVSPDDCCLVLRGMETMALRYQRAFDGAQELTRQFSSSRAIARILWPADPSSSDHALWRRDFVGAAGVFGAALAAGVSARLEQALDALRLLAIGASWGGTQSLVAPMTINAVRTARPWQGEDLVLRFSVGVEDFADLEADIAEFLSILERS